MVRWAAIGCAGYPCILNLHEVSLACHQPLTARLFFPPGLREGVAAERNPNESAVLLALHLPSY